jgi:hypothetical protein
MAEIPLRGIPDGTRPAFSAGRRAMDRADMPNVEELFG